MIIAVLVILGLALGSFANATIWRLHFQAAHNGKSRIKRGKLKDADLSIVTGRSVCMHCGHILTARDLVPVVSFVLLRGRCRYCGAKIDDTPVAELLLPVLFIISYIWWPQPLAGTGLTEARVMFGFWLLFLVGFVILALYDLRWLLLPDRVAYPLIALALAQLAVRVAAYGEGWAAIIAAGWGVLLSAGVFYLLYVISRGNWIGFGDVKLAIVLGLIVGGPLNGLFLIFLASLFGTIVALPVLAKGKAVSTTRIPFGPYLLAATVVIILAGSYLQAWYVGFLAF